MPGRILVIDDEPQITRVLRAALTAQGYDLRTANDPEEGLEIYREWSPDLVVTDLMMPGISGVEVTRAIRVRFPTPIIILSVRDHERSKVEALDAGADDYVTKPFSIQELLARVRAHLRRAPERTSAALEAAVSPELRELCEATLSQEAALAEFERTGDEPVYRAHLIDLGVAAINFARSLERTDDNGDR